eukprot:comp22210_c0_seq1/m.52466 comp22210_c0_seq1/g.52466  ORF comp22210_c0_seq1/g.52466 comp22210_c0_seq1/m.52466 type:complete len:641 (-) comp22210_c0_seq1:501-2423(-)
MLHLARILLLRKRRARRVVVAARPVIESRANHVAECLGLMHRGSCTVCLARNLLRFGVGVHGARGSSSCFGGRRGTVDRSEIVLRLLMQLLDLLLQHQLLLRCGSHLLRLQQSLGDFLQRRRQNADFVACLVARKLHRGKRGLELLGKTPEEAQRIARRSARGAHLLAVARGGSGCGRGGGGRREKVLVAQREHAHHLVIFLCNTSKKTALLALELLRGLLLGTHLAQCILELFVFAQKLLMLLLAARVVVAPVHHRALRLQGLELLFQHGCLARLFVKLGQNRLMIVGKRVVDLEIVAVLFREHHQLVEQHCVRALALRGHGALEVAVQEVDAFRVLFAVDLEIRNLRWERCNLRARNRETLQQILDAPKKRQSVELLLGLLRGVVRLEQRKGLVVLLGRQTVLAPNALQQILNVLVERARDILLAQNVAQQGLGPQNVVHDVLVDLRRIAAVVLLHRCRSAGRLQIAEPRALHGHVDAVGAQLGRTGLEIALQNRELAVELHLARVQRCRGVLRKRRPSLDLVVLLANILFESAADRCWRLRGCHIEPKQPEALRIVCAHALQLLDQLRRSRVAVCRLRARALLPNVGGEQQHGLLGWILVLRWPDVLHSASEHAGHFCKLGTHALEIALQFGDHCVL